MSQEWACLGIPAHSSAGSVPEAGTRTALVVSFRMPQPGPLVERPILGGLGAHSCDDSFLSPESFD